MPSCDGRARYTRRFRFANIFSHPPIEPMDGVAMMRCKKARPGSRPKKGHQKSQKKRAAEAAEENRAAEAAEENRAAEAA